jgi:hypothetical protein
MDFCRVTPDRAAEIQYLQRIEKRMYLELRALAQDINDREAMEKLDKIIGFIDAASGNLALIDNTTWELKHDKRFNEAVKQKTEEEAAEVQKKLRMSKDPRAGVISGLIDALRRQKGDNEDRFSGMGEVA